MTSLPMTGQRFVLQTLKQRCFRSHEMYLSTHSNRIERREEICKEEKGKRNTKPKHKTIDGDQETQKQQQQTKKEKKKKNPATKQDSNQVQEQKGFGGSAESCCCSNRICLFLAACCSRCFSLMCSFFNKF